MSDQQSDTENYVAIIDIGSNAVRLVVYDGLNRAPIKIHGERAICNLGADLAATGHLNADSMKKALDSLRRFSGLLSAMRVKNIRAVATAAVRDAKNGKSFVDGIHQEFGLTIDIIGGHEEARLSALGVMANASVDHGVIGDYGGGSLELIVVEDGQVQHKASLSLGSHRLLAETSRTERVTIIEEHLESITFLKDCTGQDFYALGGAWRSMALAHIYMTRYPLRLLDHYQVDGKKATAFAGVIGRQQPSSLEKTVGMTRKRIRDMAVAALTMERLFKRIHPERLIFSATGLREGLLFDQLKSTVLQQDPLIASCKKIAPKISHTSDLAAFENLFEWMKPLFTPESLKLVRASCLLSDGGWLEHEDYQAEHAFQRTLVMPFYGIDHAGRAFLALSQYIRYKGYPQSASRTKEFEEVTGAVQKLIDGRMLDAAITAGLAQRLGYLLTGGILGLLRHTELVVTAKKITLKLNSKVAILNADLFQETIKGLERIMEREAVVEV